MEKEQKYRELLLTLQNYMMFFLLVAFVIYCCLNLFVTTLAKTMQLTFSEEGISQAARLTFINVLGVSGIFTLLDYLRRKYITNRPLNVIVAAATKMSQGDFSVRIPRFKGILGEVRYNQVGDCFNKMAEELAGIEILRTDFIANVSHELKTPMAVMQSYGTMLQQPDLSEELRVEYAKSICDASRRFANLISNILKLNKLENQQIVLQTEDYYLDEQLVESLLQYENVWEKKNIDIVTDIQEGIRIHADAELLSLVWNNLLSNAFKFTEPGGTVSLSLSTTESDAIIKVADTGCGMSSEVGDHIFEKFYQGDTSHSTQGNGLGLALVKRVVDIMHGEISVESAIGKGSTFTIKIQRSRDDRT